MTLARVMSVLDDDEEDVVFCGVLPLKPKFPIEDLSGDAETPVDVSIIAALLQRRCMRTL